MHTPIARSKSVQSMLSLRDRGYTRESSSKDSSNGEEDVLGDAAEMTARDRRVTFRAAADRRLESVRAAVNYPLRKCASVSFQTNTVEKRLRVLSHEN